MKDIKDYLHLYLGCHTKHGKLVGIRSDRAFCEMADGTLVEGSLKAIRPILRPLSDMTEEERCEVSTLVPPDESPYWVKNIAEVTKWYLDRGFDLFGLIEAGLAIDKTTLKQN